MIIDLDAGFDHYSDAQWLEAQSVIERLITAHANGWHMLSMSRRTGTAILQSCSLSSTQTEILRDTILPKLTNIISQSRSIAYGVHCVPDDAVIVQRKNRVTVPLSYFANPNATLPAALLVESLEGDAALITFLCELFGSKLGFSSYANLNFLPGGGGSTATYYRQVANTGQAVLCVVDSDTYFPGSPVGGTARAVLAVPNTNPLARTHVVPVREVENLIPWQVFKNVYENDRATLSFVSNVTSYLNNLQVRRDDAEELIYGHYDIKNGLKKSYLRSVNEDSLGLLRCLWAHLVPTERSFDITETEENSESVVLQGVSSSAISATIAFHKRKPHMCRPFIAAAKAYRFGNLIERLVTDVLSATVAPDRLRTSLPSR